MKQIMLCALAAAVLLSGCVAVQTDARQDDGARGVWRAGDRPVTSVPDRDGAPRRGAGNGNRDVVL